MTGSERLGELSDASGCGRCRNVEHGIHIRELCLIHAVHVIRGGRHDSGRRVATWRHCTVTLVGAYVAAADGMLTPPQV
jgi:hypothetical protein